LFTSPNLDIDIILICDLSPYCSARLLYDINLNKARDSFILILLYYIDIIAAAVTTAVKAVTVPITKVLIDIVSPKRTSNASDRKHHQRDFKEALRNRYACVDPTNPSTTRCMVLDIFLGTEVVIAAHIIGLTNRLSFSALNLNSDRDIWSDRNGLLVYKDFETKYESQDIVS